MDFSGATAIDLFCGCGGMSWGLSAAGVDIRLGVDLDPKYIRSYRANFGEHRTWNDDIRSISPKALLERAGLRKGQLDLLVGGPPCQGFSKNTPVAERTWDSDNNLLVREFLRIVEGADPRFLVMENVAEMKNGFGGRFTNQVRQELAKLGYNLLDHVFDASEYGLPQKRRRAFFIAARGDIGLVIPPKTHSDSEFEKQGLFPLQDKVTVWDAIGDLPALRHGETYKDGPYPTEPKTQYQAKMRANSETLTSHTARKLSGIQFERLSSIAPGQGHKDLPEHLKVSGGYSGVYGRLTEDSVCPTITRWVFHPGSGRWGHPRDIRTLTLREVARVQGFTDEFCLEGSYNDVCGQLGNAVPPMLMDVVLECFRS